MAKPGGHSHLTSSATAQAPAPGSSLTFAHSTPCLLTCLLPHSAGVGTPCVGVGSHILPEAPRVPTLAQTGCVRMRLGAWPVSSSANGPWPKPEMDGSLLHKCLAPRSRFPWLIEPRLSFHHRKEFKILDPDCFYMWVITHQ